MAFKAGLSFLGDGYYVEYYSYTPNLLANSGPYILSPAFEL